MITWMGVQWRVQTSAEIEAAAWEDYDAAVWAGNNRRWYAIDYAWRAA